MSAFWGSKPSGSGCLSHEHKHTCAHVALYESAGMSVCMYAYMHVCMYVCMYVSFYVCMYQCMCLRMCLCSCMCAARCFKLKAYWLCVKLSHEAVLYRLLGRKGGPSRWDDRPETSKGAVASMPTPNSLSLRCFTTRSASILRKTTSSEICRIVFNQGSIT